MRVTQWVLVLSLCFLAQRSAADNYNPTQAPKCADDCFYEAIVTAKCHSSATNCLCHDKTTRQALGACVARECSVKENLATKNVTMTICDVPNRTRTAAYVDLFLGLFIVSLLCVIQRIATKIYYRAGLGMDDFFIVLAVMNGVPFLVMNSHTHLGHNIWTLTPSQINRALKDFFFSGLTYFLAIPLLKLSILFYYLQIFPDPRGRTIIWNTIAFVALSGLALVMTTLFECQPISHFWTYWDDEHDGHCSDSDVVSITNAAVDIITNFWMLAIALWQLKGLLLWRQKLEIGAMFCVGLLATVYSILRLVPVINFRQTINPTWDLVEILEKSTIELHVGIICACMPSMRLLLSRLLPRAFPASQANFYLSRATKTPTRPRPRRTFSDGFTDINLFDEDDARLVELGASKTGITRPRSWIK